MDEVTLAVQHDVAIVSVLDLQQKEQKAVGGHAADEVISSLQIGHFLKINDIIIVLDVLCTKDKLNYNNTIIKTINIQSIKP